MENNFYGQFVLAREERFIPNGYRTFELNSWIISTHKSLTVTEIYSLDNVHIGWVIGHLIDHRNEVFIEDKIIFAVSSNVPHNISENNLIDEFLYSFGGRYICILLAKDLQRVYLDAAGSLSCVYSSHDHVMASSPGLILDKRRYYADLDEELYRLLKLPKSLGWYPSGLTPHTSISRLLPNHYFDLSSWKPIRHWPRKAISSCDDPLIATEAIIHVIKSTIKTIARKYDVYLTLTGGRDSRMLLGCSAQLIQNIEFVTFTEHKETVDEYVARLLADRYKLNAKFLHVSTATEQQKSKWLYEVGYCVGGKILEIHQTLSQLDEKRVILPGFGGEVGRGFFWKRSDKDNTNISARSLLQRFNLPIHRSLTEPTDRWLGEINYLNTFQILDLAYIEQRLGCWGGPQTYGQVRFINHFYPMVHRLIFEKMLLMPPEYKRDYGLSRDVLRLEWSNLLDIPFNKFMGIRNIKEKAKKVVRYLQCN